MTSAGIARSKIFISYRRSDAEALAGRLADRLAEMFGRQAVFFDTRSIAPGDQFPKSVLLELGRARVMLVVMGKMWLTAADSSGHRRIDDSKDWVHIEVKTALAATGVTVIPVLADGQDEMIPRHALPEDLQELQNRAALSLKSGTFDRDAKPLVEQLAGLGIPPVAAQLPPKYLNKQANALSTRLQELVHRRELLRCEGAETPDIDAQILDVRRSMRLGTPERGFEIGDGRYLLLDKLGHGGFATVWKARDQRTQSSSPATSLVAMKVMHAHLAGDSVAVDRFFRGARIMSELSHPGIVRVLESRCEDQGRLYFIMELMEGGSFHSAVRERRLQQAQAIRTILKVARALSEAHSRGYVHRDVKPSNILLTAELEPKLSDFDLVGVADTTGGTRTGALGTYAYSSPECLSDPKEAGPSADVYSLGMTLVFALTGEEPNQLTLDRSYEQIQCTNALRQILGRATSLNPRDRYSTASEFVVAIEQLELRPKAPARTIENRGSGPARILLLDHPVPRRGLRDILAESLGDVICGEASSAHEAIEKAKQMEWDLFILDISMPGIDGLEVCRKVKQLRPDLPILVLSRHPEEHNALQALRAGAAGYLRKNALAEEIGDAVLRTIRGGMYLGPRLAEILAESVRSGAPARKTL